MRADPAAERREYPLESLLAGKRARSWNFSAQNSRIKNRVQKGLGWFGLAVYFTAIPPHVQREWTTIYGVPGVLYSFHSGKTLASQSKMVGAIFRKLQKNWAVSLSFCRSAVLSIFIKVFLSLVASNKMRKTGEGKEKEIVVGVYHREFVRSVNKKNRGATCSYRPWRVFVGFAT